MNEKRNKNRRFEAGVSLIVVATLLISGISMVSGADFVKDSSPSLSKTGNEDMNPLCNPLVPHPIYGTATWEGGGNADGAGVAVTSSLGTLSTTVSSGAWMVDCGDPGPNWPSGTSFSVTITGSGSHAGWSGSTSGSVGGYYNTMGNVVVNNDAPNNPSNPSGDTPRVIGQIGNYSTSATDSGEQVQYIFDWDASGSHSYSSWSSLVNSGQSVTMSNSWGSAGTYVVKAKARDHYGKESTGWSNGLTVVVSAPNHAPGIPSTPSGPASLVTGQSGTYSTSATDSDNDQVQYMFDWDASGSHSYSPWTSLVSSGQSGSMSHSWGSAGMYVVKAKARDEYGLESNEWSDGLTVIVKRPQPGNHNPNTPVILSGPTTGKVGISYTFSTSTADPDNDNVSYGWDWDGDGVVNIDDWTGLYPDDTTVQTSHIWDAAGTYNMKVKAKDEHGAMSDFSPTWTVEISINNLPEKPDKPSGTEKGKTNKEYTYSTKTTDTDGDQVYYNWSWGDGTFSGWLGPFDSGVTIDWTHKWTVDGAYSIKVKAKDAFGAESPWSDPFTITMPFSLNKPMLQFLELLFERFPHAFPILRHLLGY